MFNKCNVFKSLSEGVRSNGEHNLFILQQLPQWCDILGDILSWTIKIQKINGQRHWIYIF